MNTQKLRWLSVLVITLGCLGLVACDGSNAGDDPESICDDGIDNDSDGLLDCADPDCATSMACPGECDHDGVCDAGEDGVGCPGDCPIVCGDGRCEGSENPTSCPPDCAVCGDGNCGVGEDRVSCLEDCIACDDGFCDAGEDRVGCPEDCAVCDDGVCEGHEDRVNCLEDCLACDDGFCDAGEDRVGCPEDCAVCDDGFCDTGEDRISCPDDCATCGDAICDSNEDRLTCPDDCILCGDTFCDTGETIANCPLDCATVLINEDFATWVPAGWTATGWLQITSGPDTLAQCTNACIAQDALLESPAFSTVGFSNVWVSFTQEYLFAGTGVWSGMYVDAPPDYYTIDQPTDLPPGVVVYDISTEAANRASVQIEFSIGCANTSQCFLNDFWRFTDVLVWAW